MSLKAKEDLEKEFFEYFESCRKQGFTKSQMREICKPLEKRIRRRKLKKILVVLSVCMFVVYLCNTFEVISWTLSAVGRLAMIKLLPYWDWTPLYSAKCLINNPYHMKPEVRTSGTVRDTLSTDPRNCIMCERYGKIDVRKNTSFGEMQKNYLNKGLPIMVADSHPPCDFSEFLKRMKSAIKFVESDPCDVENSLMLTEFVNIEELLLLVGDQDESSEWFFQLRNCQFHAVKDSRRFIPKPYYYAQHLEPFYSSWILMSNNFGDLTKELFLDGLVIVRQITGRLLVTLTAKEPCEDICGEHYLLINEGDALVFTTDLWIFTYTLDNVGKSVTAITETHWTL